MARPGGTLVRTGPGGALGGRVGQVHREGAFVVGARGSWTVVGGRSSIERGMGCFCWVSCGGLGLVLFLPGLLSGDTARRGVAGPGEPTWGRPARVIDGCWRVVW
jgi:hypothetical protein